MSVLNSHKSAGNSFAAADRSMRWVDHGRALGLECGDSLGEDRPTTEPTNAGSYVPARQTLTACREGRDGRGTVVGEGVPDLIGGRGVLRTTSSRAEEYRSVGHVAAIARPRPDRR
jgi:hypothetical protein